jgi:hypothetical protein
LDHYYNQNYGCRCCQKPNGEEKKAINWFYSQEQPLLVGGMETMGGVEKQELQTDVRSGKHTKKE